MNEPGSTSRESGEEPPNSLIGPFAIFGYAVAVAGAWAIYEMLVYADLPTFTVAMLPTVAGIVIALGVFFGIGARAPSNE